MKYIYHIWVCSYTPSVTGYLPYMFVSDYYASSPLHAQQTTIETLTGLYSILPILPLSYPILPQPTLAYLLLHWIS